MQARLVAKWARLVRPTIQFFLVVFAVYVGYTRVSDYQHHWSDVLVGLLQGALVAVLNVSLQATPLHPLRLNSSTERLAGPPNAFLSPELLKTPILFSFPPLPVPDDISASNTLWFGVLGKANMSASVLASLIIEIRNPGIFKAITYEDVLPLLFAFKWSFE